MALLDELAVRGVEDREVDGVDGEHRLRVRGRVGLGLDAECVGVRLDRAGSLFAEARVRVVEGGDVGRDRERAGDLGVLRVKLGLVEVVGVRHVRTMDRCDTVNQWWPREKEAGGTHARTRAARSGR